VRRSRSRYHQHRYQRERPRNQNGPLAPRRLAPWSPRYQCRAWRTCRSISLSMLVYDSPAFVSSNLTTTTSGVRTLPLRMLAPSSVSTFTAHTHTQTAGKPSPPPKPYCHQHQRQVSDHKITWPTRHYVRRPLAVTKEDRTMTARSERLWCWTSSPHRASQHDVVEPMHHPSAKDSGKGELL